MRTFKAAAAFFAVAISLSGCMGDQAKTQIRDQAAISAADERDWPNLTPEQRRQAAHDSAKSWATLNYSVNGVPVPAPYADPSPTPSPASSAK